MPSKSFCRSPVVLRVSSGFFSDSKIVVNLLLSGSWPRSSSDLLENEWPSFRPTVCFAPCTSRGEMSIICAVATPQMSPGAFEQKLPGPNLLAFMAII